MTTKKARRARVESFTAIELGEAEINLSVRHGGGSKRTCGGEDAEVAHLTHAFDPERRCLFSLPRLVGGGASVIVVRTTE